ncbi:carboxypeptidase-like regulatory domain-containing protein [Adhaeribacter terreus]|uniref:Carboxypeptidase-like regulatory domain-containing protein n=1 Tax=Adhaeribacter terreus TaxID=529703 RepID=A0ABW0EBI2_9BACT
MRGSFLIAIFALFCFGCQRHIGQFNCETSILEIDPVKSEVLSFKRIKASDSIETYITGMVLGRGTYSQLKPDTLPFENIYIWDNVSGERFRAASDSNGRFKYNLPGSTYDLVISGSVYGDLKIKNIALNHGEGIELQVLLGIGKKDNTIYEMTSEDDLKLIY